MVTISLILPTHALWAQWLGSRRGWRRGGRWWWRRWRRRGDWGDTGSNATAPQEAQAASGGELKEEDHAHLHQRTGASLLVFYPPRTRSIPSQIPVPVLSQLLGTANHQHQQQHKHKHWQLKRHHGEPAAALPILRPPLSLSGTPPGEAPRQPARGQNCHGAGTPAHTKPFKWQRRTPSPLPVVVLLHPRSSQPFLCCPSAFGLQCRSTLSLLQGEGLASHSL